MNVFIATAGDEAWNRELRAEVVAVARRDRFGVHVVVEEPRDSDIVLFVDAHQHLTDWRMHALRTHPLVRARPMAAFVYDERDVPRDLLPGVYVSMPRNRFDAERHRAVGYYWLKTDTTGVRGAVPDLLFSFAGRATGGVRDAVLALRHPRAIVEDTTRYDFFAGDRDELAPAQERYREVIGRSKFVLCPRGAGSASLRLFEALAAGRVPVILSDAWVEPAGIAWASCALCIPERDVAGVPAQLERAEAQWPAMSAAAAAVYDEWFAPDVWFHRVVECCRELGEAGRRGVRRQQFTIGYWRDGARRLRHGRG
ncbi:MAG: exostosin family protein [Solirubrobacteraceae bacterium]